MILHPVGSTAARVALHRSAHSRGYKLSREGADPRSLQGRCVYVVLARSIFHPPLVVAPASPFIVPKGGSGYICDKT
jgi:hypothetical protein